MQRDTGAGMTNFWRRTDQNSWYTESEVITEKTAEKIAQSASFDEIYQFLVEERVRVAYLLNQTQTISPESIRWNRATIIPHEGDSGTSYTPILMENLRSGTIQDYLALFNDCDPQEVAPDISIEDLLNQFNFREFKDRWNEFKIGTPKRFAKIFYEDSTYSCLIEANTISANTSKNFTNYLIIHTHPGPVAGAVKKAKELFDALNDSSVKRNELEKIKLMKEMMWHLAHAMPQARGSAAINEWLLGSLLKFHKIDMDSDTSLKFDLIALFTPSPERFSERFEINESIENENSLLNEKLRLYGREKSPKEILEILIAERINSQKKRAHGRAMHLIMKKNT